MKMSKMLLVASLLSVSHLAFSGQEVEKSSLPRVIQYQPIPPSVAPSGINKNVLYPSQTTTIKDLESALDAETKDTKGLTPRENLHAKLNYILDLVDESYISDPDMKKIADGLFGGMLSKLDPHSAYFDVKQLKTFSDATKGSFGGIGVSIESDGDLVKVISVVKGSPAHSVGVRDGDAIVRIGEKVVQGMELDEVVDMIRGPRGTPVEITVKHEDSLDPVIMKITRDIITEQVITTSFEDGIMYMHLTHFKENLTREMVTEINKSIATNGTPKGFILDLRSNPGGSLNESVGVASVFLPNDTKVVTIKGRSKQDVQVLTTRDFDNKAYAIPKYFDTLPLVVLINNGSASASEIVAGAMRSYNRATLVGQTTFGKGSVQSLINLPDQSGIKITIAKYYTPDDKTIQALGVNPNIYLKEIEVQDVKLEDGAVKSNWSKVLARKEKGLDNHLYGEEKTKVIRGFVPSYTIPKQDYLTQIQYNRKMIADSKVDKTLSTYKPPLKESVVFGGHDDIYVNVATKVLNKQVSDIIYPNGQEEVLDFASYSALSNPQQRKKLN